MSENLKQENTMNRSAEDSATDPVVSQETTQSAKGSEEHKHHSHHHSHHHHSHHHHHHSHGSSHRSSRKKRKIKRFFRKNKYKLTNLVACVVVIALLVTLALQWDSGSNVSEQGQSAIEITQSSYRIESSLYTQEVSLVDDVVLTFLSEDNTKNAAQLYSDVKTDATSISFGRPVVYTYDVVGLPSGITVQGGMLEASENKNFTNALKYSVINSASTIDLYNLKTGTKYYYRLTLNLSNNTAIGTSGEFTTKTSPRILNIDGIKNVRDIGGWSTLDGRTIKQGMLYRGIELDGAVESTFRLSQKGISEMVDTLGIRFEMDLRNTTVNSNKVNMLGSGVTHKYYPVLYYEDVFQDNQKETVRRIFSDLANKNNYPVYLHCTYGRDRTGTICYLLEGLLGMSEEDAYKEYQLTAFSGSLIEQEAFEKFQDKVNAMKGKTFQDKVEGYLLSIGVTTSEMESIREIFLG